MHRLLTDIPPEDVYILDPEGGLGYDYREGGCRILLAVGRIIDVETGQPDRRVAIALREETLATLWACRLTRATIEALPSSPLFHLPVHWVPSTDSPDAPPADGVGEDGGMTPVLRLLDEMLLLRPEAAVFLLLGDNRDDAVVVIALVGVDEGAGGRKRAVFFQEEWLERLWQTLLLDSGGFAVSGSELEEWLADCRSAESLDDEPKGA